MGVRSIGELKRDQARMLAELRAATVQVFAPTIEASPPPAGGHAVGRVAEVAETDAEHGPHLKVVLQYLKGTPPAAADASLVAVVCYPLPGAPVGAFAVDELVWVCILNGVRIVRKA